MLSLPVLRTAAALALVALSTGAAQGSAASADHRQPGLVEEEPQDCSRVVPAVQTLDHVVVSPSSPAVRLDVLVLAEAKDLPAARKALGTAGRAYAPLRIDLVPRFRQVRIPDLRDDERAYVAWAKRFLGGLRPAGVDVVYLATSRTLAGGGAADCIGGVAYPDRAFAAGQLSAAGTVGLRVVGAPPPPDGPAVPDGGAKVAAHEIGHLLGGQHELGADCRPGSDDPTHPCDVMLSVSAQSIGLRFGALNGAVVRDHALRFARP